MTDTIIRVENLGKKYVIPHGGAKRSDTFRDALMNGMRSAVRRLRHPLTPSANGSSREEFWALKDVSFEVKRGEVVGIIGCNGAGKSTLLKILSRITEPTTGRVTINGRVASLLEVGTGFHPELSGRENIYLNGAILGMSRAEIARKFDEIVAFAEVEKFLDTAVKHYSSGMYVRLAFAVAAHLHPEILLVDEVLAVGDIEFQKKCMGKMESIAGSGNTVILVSHSLGTVKALCSSAVLFENGKKKAHGDPTEVATAYLGSFTADPVERVICDGDYLYGGEKLRIETIKLLNAAFDSFSVHWRQPISIVLEINVLEALDGVSLGVGIKLLDGTWFCWSHHDDKDMRLRLTLNPGRYAMRFTLQNDLKPGMYKLAAGGHHHHFGKNLCHVEAVNLQVMDYSREGLIPMVFNAGIVDAAAVWEGPMPL